MRKLLLITITAILVTTGWGCNQEPEGNIPVIQPTWEVYENTQHGFAFQYPGKYIFDDKDLETRSSYLGIDMQFLLSIDEIVTEGDGGTEPILYVYFAENTSLDQFKQSTANGYGGVEGTGLIVSEEWINQGGLQLILIENTTAMPNTNKNNYIQERENGLLIFSPFIYREGYWEEMLETLHGISGREAE